MVGGLELSKGVEGMLMPHPNGSGEWGIIYNETIRSPGRRNFTLAHELGHYLLHRQTNPNGLECSNRNMADWDEGRNKIEGEANTFASYLLMPLDDFRAQIKDRPIDIDVMTDLADRYAVSLTAAILKWMTITKKRAMIVVGKDGFIDWAWSSEPLIKSGIFYLALKMPKLTGVQRKQAYVANLGQLVQEYTRILIVQADNVGSNQIQQIRKSTRGQAVLLMGKNTTIRKAMRGFIEKNKKLEALMPLIRGNVGFVFTKGDLKEVRDLVAQNRRAAPARAGAIAPADVKVPPGSTGLDPAQTSFFQALSIPTKISKGAIEIINEVHLIHEGEKVSPSQAALLAKLKIEPFSYGLEFVAVYQDGQVYAPSVLDITDKDLARYFSMGSSNVAAVSLAVGEANMASLPHLFVKGVKNVAAVSVATDYDIEATKKIKEYLKDPSAFAAANASAAPAAASDAKADAKAEEKEESGDDDMGFGLFD